MEVKNIIVCDDVINQPGPNGMIPNLLSPYANVSLPTLPTSFSFSIFIIIDGAPNSPGDFVLNIYHQDTPDIIEHSVTMNIESTMLEQMPKKKHSSINFAVNIRNMFFKVEGLYVFDLYYNEDKLNTQTIGFYKFDGEV